MTEEKKAKAKKKKAKLVKMKSKKYTEAYQKVDHAKKYSLTEGCDIVKTISTSKFDGTVEAHIRLNFDTSKDSVRGNFSLPHGSGKSKKIIVFADDKLAEEAKKAGAVEAGNKSLVEKIQKGWFDFDVAIAHPAMMPEVGKLGKILGTKGLMPNPKAGTITPDVVKAVSEFSLGKAEFKADGNGIVHVPIGKISFDANKLNDNFLAALEAIKKAKPQKIKGKYLVSAFLSPTMGPSVNIDISEF